MLYKMYLLPFFAIVQHWRIKPLQLFLMVAGLTTATALWNSVHLINEEAQSAYSDAQIISTMSTKKNLISKSNSYFSDKYFGELRKKGWLITPRLQGEIKDTTRANLGSITVIGIDPLSANRGMDSKAFPIKLSPNEFLRGTRVILAGPNTAKTLSKLTNFQNIELSQNLPEGYALTDISIAQNILGKRDKLTSLQIVGPLPNNLNPIEKRGLKIHLNENNTDLSSLTKSFHLNLTAFGFLSYIVSLFIVYSTISLAFEQRKGILKGLRNLGLSSITVTNLMLFEILLISFMSGVLGIILSYFLASALLPDVAITLNGIFGASIKNHLSMDKMFWFNSLIIATFGAVCASAPTLWKSLSLNPIESTKKINWYEKTRINLQYQLIATGIIIGLIIYLFKFGSGIINAFLLLGATLISATLLLPLLLWFTLSVIIKYDFKKPLLNWFFADCKQQINSLSVSLMALLIALSVNVGVGGMVESFKKTFIGWLDQRLVSELYIRTTNSNLSEEIKEILEGKVDALLPIVKVSQNIFDTTAEIYGFSPHHTYSDHWPLILKSNNVWVDLRESKGVLINEQLSRRLNLDISNYVEFESKRGVLVQLKILGVYSDYGNPKGQVMLPLELFNHYFPNEPELSFAVRLPETLIDQTQEILNTRFSKDEITITNQIEIKNFSTKIFEKTFTITAALSILTLGVAGMALFTSITTLADNRYTQLAPLWCIGTKLKTLALLELLRFASLSALTFIFAIPIGLAVVYILTNYVNLEAFGWKLPIYFFPMQWLSLGIVTISITLIASCFHSIKLTAASPTQILKASQYDT